jgi:hypothetical protein
MINSSHLRQEFFYSLQNPSNKKDITPLRLIKDCPTRWSSTTTCIIRALHLRQAVDAFVETYPEKDKSSRHLLKQLRISKLGWKQLGYMAEITCVIGTLTNVYGNKAVENAGHVLAGITYIVLHLNHYLAVLQKKATRDQSGWHQQFIVAICAAKVKAEDYFSKLQQKEHIYGLAALLTPLEGNKEDKRFRRWAAMLNTSPQQLLDKAKKHVERLYRQYRPYQQFHSSKDSQTQGTFLDRVLYDSPEKRKQQDQTVLDETNVVDVEISDELDHFYMQSKQVTFLF